MRPQIVDQFTRELARHPAPVVRPLPPHLEPLARAVGGSPRARISTSTASRRALERVDRVAATTGDVIHVVRTPGPDPASAEIMAHELAHTATPVAEPRFFDDPRPSADERRATVAGEIAKRVAREFEPDGGGGPRGTAALPVGGMSGLFGSIDERPASGGRLQRSPARQRDSAASVHRGSAPAGTAAGRAGGGSDPAALAPLVTDLPEAVRRLTESPSTAPSPPAGGAPLGGAQAGGAQAGGAPLGAAAPAPPEEQHAAAPVDLDAVVEALERRVIEELERRGRFRPEVF